MNGKFSQPDNKLLLDIGLKSGRHKIRISCYLFYKLVSTGTRKRRFRQSFLNILLCRRGHPALVHTLKIWWYKIALQLSYKTYLLIPKS